VVLVVDLCGEDFCTDDATVAIEPLYEALKTVRPKLCPKHEAEFREKAAARNIIEGEHYRVVPLCS
jgi:hypothetical protein